MVALILAVGAAIYFTAEKVRTHKEKKRASKAQEALQHGLVEPVSIIDDTTPVGNPPPYHKGNLPPYH
ncbi:uncharacterized protein Z518_07317 [Rhinocladiella mackenziei CBS 650.93]|uniref:Uncharacterized protein n=1 Tax=Rhinocladiella mackenziei CBS 650.93 TaxID=1442369 RepID=A0A0D2ID44_9EURO|nr:uncharacterized protein Z518_07317 [Rhinocladiella mackenziei CBS 650.93]KIX03764.1 hypothetical protein Z518_07317 [Rhinocladiella mackenziei CBS 650.93]